MTKAEKNGTTAAQRRMAVAIAKDVLASSRHWNVKQGGYLEVCEWEIKGKEPFIKEGEPIPKGADPKAFRHCTVCAKGAMFLSRARLFDHCTLEESGVSGQIALDIGIVNAGLIEAAFERAAGFAYYEGAFTDQVDAAVKFGEKAGAYDSRKRLRAIMKNVINNEGVFRP